MLYSANNVKIFPAEAWSKDDLGLDGIDNAGDAHADPFQMSDIQLVPQLEQFLNTAADKLFTIFGLGFNR